MDKKYFGPNFAISFFLGVGPKIKVTQNGLEHTLALKFLKTDEISSVAKSKQPTTQPTNTFYRTRLSPQDICFSV